MFAFLGDGWQWLKDHDAPNWFAILFSLVVWPLVIYWWNTRKTQSIPHLEVRPEFPSQVNIPLRQSHAVELTFTNATHSVVYLHHARLRENQKNFPAWAPGRD